MSTETETGTQIPSTITTGQDLVADSASVGGGQWERGEENKGSDIDGRVQPLSISWPTPCYEYSCPYPVQFPKIAYIFEYACRKLVLMRSCTMNINCDCAGLWRTDVECIVTVQDVWHTLERCQGPQDHCYQGAAGKSLVWFVMYILYTIYTYISLLCSIVRSSNALPPGNLLGTKYIYIYMHIYTYTYLYIYI